jgi:subtilisin family serine protease
MNSVVIRLILLSFIFCNIYAAGNQHSKEKVVPGVIIIKFRESMALAKTAGSELEKIWQKYAIQQFEPVMGNTRNLMKQGGSSALNSVYYVYYNSQASPFVVAEELKKSSTWIIYAEPKYLHFISESLVESPDDSLYHQQYSLRKINAAEAWDITRGEQGEIVIAIVDGGTEINHPDLTANVWTNEVEANGVTGKDDDGNNFVDDIHGWNFPNNNNDPTGLPTTPLNANHGTHTAGITSAVTDNSIGISGASFNAKIMAVNSGSLVSDNSIAYGYDGILYAAGTGADIISCSWGRSGGLSQFEQEVIDEATARGAVVVAAAGNNNSDGNYFPAQYNNVFSVAAVDSNDVKASFSNYGPEIDVSAPGVSILSTLTSERYGSMSGTSMSCPLAAGVIALVKTKNSSWNGVQAAEQVRVTSDNIDSQNPAYLDDLGAGRINALTALTAELPSIRIIDIQYMDDAGDGIIEPGDMVNIDVQVMNYLKPANNIIFELVEDDQFVEVLAGNARLDQLETLQSASLPTSLKLQIHPDAPTGYIVRLKLKITSAGYQDADYFSLMVLPTFASADVNNIAVTVTNIGRIGFADINLTDTGIGFTYKDDPNLIYEGAIIAGISSSRISNAARGADPYSDSDQDFEVTQDGNLEVHTPGSVSAQESIGKFADIYASSPLPIQVQQMTFASNDPDKDDFVIFKYRIVNTGRVPLKDFYFGLFFDWDLDGENYITNKTGYDHTRNLGYVYDTGNGPETYAGVSVVSDQNVNFRAIFNDESVTENPSWGIYDGFTDDEKWSAISEGITLTEAGPEDISFTIAGGPVIIDPGAVVVIGFAMIAADNLADLQVHADSAKVFWSHLLPLGMDDDKFETQNPYVYALNQNYPNPFNPVTRILFSIPKSEEVKLSIFNVLGERVETLVSKNLSAGQYEIRWNAAGYASGVYFYQLRAGDFVQRRKMLLIR